MNFSQEEVKIYLAKNIRLIEQPTTWNNYLQTLKRNPYPYSTELMELFNTTDWRFIVEIAKNTRKTHTSVQHLTDETEIQEVFDLEARKLILLKRLIPYKDTLNIPSSAYISFVKQVAMKDKITLPSLTTLYRSFNTWNDVKLALGLSPDEMIVKAAGPHKKYTSEQIMALLLKYPDKFNSIVEWDEFAKKNGLPSYVTLTNYVTPEMFKEYTNYRAKRNISETDLINIIKSHKEQFSKSVRKWNTFAQENDLPAYITFVRRLGREKIDELLREY